MVEEPGRQDALKVFDLQEEIVARDLIVPEVASVFRKKVIRGEMTLAQAEAGLQAIGELISRFVPCAGLASEAWALSQRLGHSVYDCFYLACAVPSAKLFSADIRFVDKCRAAGLVDVVISPANFDSLASKAPPT